MEELAIKNAAPKTAELLRKKLNLFCFLVAKPAYILTQYKEL